MNNRRGTRDDDAAFQPLRVIAVVAAENIRGSVFDQDDVFDDAVDEFSNALSLPGLDPATETNLRFQLGLAHEAAGRPQEALAEFEHVYAQQANYPDVAQKIKALRRALENV